MNSWSYFYDDEEDHVVESVYREKINYNLSIDANVLIIWSKFLDIHEFGALEITDPVKHTSVLIEKTFFEIYKNVYYWVVVLMLDLINLAWLVFFNHAFRAVIRLVL